jgi:hypothetical protein
MYRLVKFSPGGGDLADVTVLQPTGHLAIWGILGGCAEILKQAIRFKRSYYFVDRAYFRRGSMAQRNTRYRITHNRMQAGNIVPRPADRWQALNIGLSPRRHGKEILICPPTEFACGFYGAEATNWLPQTLARLQTLTDRPLVIRTKPRPGDGQPSLDAALRNAWAVVTFNSNVAVDALVAGVPVFTAPYSAAAPIANIDLGTIESPWFPDRRPWCYHLAYCQFKYCEILDGSCWRYL